MTRRHTEALTYTWWERLYFKIHKRWPQSVVKKRLDADDLDRIESYPWTIG